MFLFQRQSAPTVETFFIEFVLSCILYLEVQSWQSCVIIPHSTTSTVTTPFSDHFLSHILYNVKQREKKKSTMKKMKKAICED